MDKLGPYPCSSKPFWKKINRLRTNNVNSQIPTLRIEDKEFKTDKEKGDLFRSILCKTFSTEKSIDLNEGSTENIDSYIHNKKYLEHYSNVGSFFPEIDLDELKKTIKKINKDSSAGPDIISYRLIKNLPESFLKKILNFFNLCLAKSIIPKQWKISRISMIPKKRTSNDPSKYRPISVTSCLGKILERIVRNRLYKYLEENNLICLQQSGFRTHRRTADNLVFMTQKISETFNRKKKVCSLFFDISQAFDKTWHNGILYKMSQLKVPLYIFEWVREFLNNRKFFVKVNDYSSAQGDIQSVVPQGAVISPLLFTIFINDIPKLNSKNNSYSLLFADDLVSFFIFKKYGKIVTLINYYLKKIEAWLVKWKMKMAPEKCSHTIFSENPGKNQSLTLKLFGKNIPYEKKPLFLGITFDENLCFNSHVEFIRSRCVDRINILKILAQKSWKLNYNTLVNIYKTLIGSIIDYSFFIPVLVSKTNLSRLQVLQNISIKYSYNFPQDTPSDLLVNFLDDIKLDSIEARLNKLFLKYLKNSVIFKNTLIIELIKDYVSAFVNSSRPCKKKTPLCNLWNEFSEWLNEKGLSL